MGTMPGLIERYNGQHVVSLTANIHGLTLGKAADKLNQALSQAGAPPRGVSVVTAWRNSSLWSRLCPGCASACCWQCCDFSATGSQFPVGASGAGDRSYNTRGAVRSAVDVAGNRHYFERSVVYGSDHGDRHCCGEFDSIGNVLPSAPSTTAEPIWRLRRKALPAGCELC